MGFAVSARHTTAGAVEIARRRKLEQLREKHNRYALRLTGTRKADFEAFEQLIADEQGKEAVEKALDGFRRRSIASRIMKEAAEFHGVTTEDIMSASRKSKIVVARQHAIYEVRRQAAHLSLPRIGHIFGGRDHTTVLHSIRSWPKKAAKLRIPCEPIIKDLA